MIYQLYTINPDFISLEIFRELWQKYLSMQRDIQPFWGRGRSIPGK